MLKLKMLVGFAVVLGALMATAAPALALFQSLPTKAQTTSGKVTIINAGTLTANDTKGASQGTVKCPAAGVTSEWKIRSTGKLTEETKGPNQQPTKRGPHLQFQVKWENTVNGCVTTALGMEFATDVAECQIQLHQPAGVLLNVPADIVSDCVIKVPNLNCTSTIAAANEATGENFQLTKANLNNKAENVLVKGDVTGLTQKAVGAGCPLQSDKLAELRGLEFEPIGVNAV